MAMDISPPWTFPAPALDITVNANFLNKPIFEFLQASAQNPPSTGFGATPVYIKDTIELAGHEESNYQSFCLQCLEPYPGSSGWDACENFTQNSSIRIAELIINVASPFTFEGVSQDAPVSAAICTFAKPLPKTETASHSLTVAYPFINKAREDSSTHTFSQTVPSGRRNLVPTLRTGNRWSKEIVLKASPRHQMEKRKGGGGGGGGKGGGGAHYSGGGGGGGEVSTQTIVIIIVVIIVVFILIIVLTMYYQNYKKKEQERQTKAKYESTTTLDTGAGYDVQMQSFETPAQGSTNPPASEDGKIEGHPPVYQAAYQDNTHSGVKTGDVGTLAPDSYTRGPSMERHSISNDSAPLLNHGNTTGQTGLHGQNPNY